MGFMTFGLAKGLAHRNNWDADLDRAIMNERLNQEARIEKDAKVKYWAEKAEFGKANNLRDAKRYEMFAPTVMDEATDYEINNPNWEASAMGTQKMMYILKGLKDNPILIDDANYTAEYAAFQDAMDNKLLNEEQVADWKKRFNDYANSDPIEQPDLRPPRFSVAPKVDYEKIFNDAALSVGTTKDVDVRKGIFGTVTSYDPGDVFLIGKNVYRQNKYAMDLLIDTVDPHVYKELYGSDPYKFTQKQIESRMSTVFDAKGQMRYPFALARYRLRIQQALNATPTSYDIDYVIPVNEGRNTGQFAKISPLVKQGATAQQINAKGLIHLRGKDGTIVPLVVTDTGGVDFEITSTRPVYTTVKTEGEAATQSENINDIKALDRSYTNWYRSETGDTYLDIEVGTTENYIYNALEKYYRDKGGLTDKILSNYGLEGTPTFPVNKPIKISIGYPMVENQSTGNRYNQEISTEGSKPQDYKAGEVVAGEEDVEQYLDIE